MGFNKELLRLALRSVSDGQQKAAFQPGPAAQGPPPGDPMAAGGPPPGMPPMDPAAAGGGMPPGGDPSMGGGMPPIDPSMLMGLLGAGGGGLPAGPPPAPPSDQSQQQSQSQPAPAPAKKKFDPAMLDLRLWHIEKKLAAIMNALNIALPADSMTLPPQGDLMGEGGLEPLESPQEDSGSGGGGGGGESKTAQSGKVSPDLAKMAAVVSRVFGD